MQSSSSDSEVEDVHPDYSQDSDNEVMIQVMMKMKRMIQFMRCVDIEEKMEQETVVCFPQNLVTTLPPHLENKHSDQPLA